MNKINIVLSFTSFVFSVIAIFVMYYIFAGVSLILGIATINDEKTRGLSITSIVIVCITFIFKMLYIVIKSGKLPEWLTSGIF